MDRTSGLSRLLGNQGLARMRLGLGFLREIRFSPWALRDWLRLRHILEGSCAVRTVAAGEEVGLFAALREGPRSLAELRRDLDLPPECLRALVDSAMHFKLLRLRHGRVEATHVLVRLWSANGLGSAFTAYCVANAGRAAPRAIRVRPHGHSGDEFYRAMGCRDPAAIRRYGSYMAATASTSRQVLAQVWDLADVRAVLDVGGGLGHVSRELVRRNPGLRATVTDVPAICAEGERLGGGERVRFHPADFVAEPLPTGHDAILFSRVLHDWDGETVDALLAKAHDVLDGGGQVAIFEILRERELGNVGPVVMAQWEVILGGTGGDVRTADDYRARLERAGFAGVAVRHPLDLQGWSSLITAWKP